MSYAIRFGFRQEEVIHLKGCSLPAVIAVCQDMRHKPEYQARRMYSAPEIFRPDNIDLDCADGLNRSEREIIEEAGL